MVFPETYNPLFLTENVPILGLYAQLIAINPTPERLQLVRETDTGREKVGNGYSAFNDLNYNLQPFKETTLVSGVMNGVNTTFVFKDVPLQVFQNGQLLKEGVGYTLTIATKTIVVTNAPFSGEQLTANSALNLQ